VNGDLSFGLVNNGDLLFGLVSCAALAARLGKSLAGDLALVVNHALVTWLGFESMVTRLVFPPSLTG